MIDWHPDSKKQFKTILWKVVEGMEFNPHGDMKENGEKIRYMLESMFNKEATSALLSFSDIVLGELARNLSLQNITNK